MPPNLGLPDAPPGGRDGGREGEAPEAPLEREPVRTARPPGLLLVLIVALAGIAYRSLALWHPPTRWISGVEGWFFVASEISPQVVFLLTAFLLVRRRHRLREALGTPGAPGLAAMLLVPGFLLFLWGQYVSATDLVVASVPAVAIGAALLVAGAPLARALVLPVALLVFAIPVPGALTNHLIHPLQLSTAHLSAWLLGTVGVTTVQEGEVLVLADRAFEVIETCSGLRSIETLTMVAVAYAAFFPASRLHRLLLVAAAPAIAFLLNGVRVATLVFDPEFDTVAIHIVQGMTMLLGGLVALYLLDCVLLRFLAGAGGRPGPTPQRASVVPTGRGARGPTVALVFLLGAMAAVSLWLPRWESPATGTPPPLTLPEQVRAWKGREVQPDSLFLGTVRFTQRSSVVYERDGESVTVFLGSDDRRRRSQSLLSRKNALPGRGCDVEEAGRQPLERGGLSLEVVVARCGGRRVLSYHGYQGVEGVAGETWRAALAVDQSPFGRRRGARVIRLSTPVEATREGREQAEVRLLILLQLLRPWLLE